MEEDKEFILPQIKDAILDEEEVGDKEEIGEEEEEKEKGVDEDNTPSPPKAKQQRAGFCICRSKCMKKPYCSCKKRNEVCNTTCHPNNTKCINK